MCIFEEVVNIPFTLWDVQVPSNGFHMFERQIKYFFPFYNVICIGNYIYHTFYLLLMIHSLVYILVMAQPYIFIYFSYYV
jgi:hypothetical protein